MKHTHNLEQSILIALDSATRTLRAVPGKDQQPPLHARHLSTLGFEPDGTSRGGIRRKSFKQYLAMLDKFAAENPGRVPFVHPSPADHKRKWVLVAVKEEVTDDIPEDEVFEFSEPFRRGDLTKWGASDWYDDKRTELIAAITSGKCFDTGWHGCKKEILSTCISRVDGIVECSVSVSDDFDTEGTGTVTLTVEPGESPETTLERMEKALDEAHAQANQCRKDNQVYRGFSVTDKTGSWVETYVQAWEGSEYYSQPPGDEYHRWGWQKDGAKIPAKTREKLEDWACSYLEGQQGSLTIGQWTTKPWSE